MTAPRAVPTRTFQVAGSAGRPVRAVAHGEEDAPAILVAHGFKGFKDWGPWPWLGNALAQQGWQAIRFDFSHNGVEATDFDRLDLFLLDTPDRHQEDLRALAAAVPGPLALVGHSRGGADVLRFAATETRVQAVATLASVATTRFAPPDLEDTLRTQGSYPIPNARTGQTMPMGREAFEVGAGIDLTAEVATTRMPLLLIHGDADTSIPLEAMHDLQAARPDAETCVIPGTGHTFGAVHPFAGPTPALETVLEALVAFFSRTFAASS